MNEIFSLVYSYARAAWRRRWWAVTIAWIVALLAWGMVLLMPDRYQASARVFVEASTPLRPVLEGIAIEDNHASQVARVREALLSRPQLEAVARRTNLDAQVTTPAGMEALITALQEQIQVVSFSADEQQHGPVRDMIYTISYQHTDRDTSVEVVRTLLDNFREGAASGSRTGAGEAQDFLGEQIDEVEKRLQEYEAQLADFKKRHVGMLPGERGDFFTRLDQEMNGLQQAETNLAVANGRRDELQRQLQGMRPYVPGTGGAAGAGAAPDVTLRRQEAERRLEELLQRFTDRHHEVIAQRQTVEELRSRETRELAELERGGAGTGDIRSLNANPVYQQTEALLSQVQVEIAAHQSAAAQHRREIASLRRFVDQAPEIEQEYTRLTRGYDVTQARYEELLARREQARVSDDAARSGIVRFDVIEPPRAGINPVSPNRPLLFIACLALAIGAGVGLALLPQLLSPTVDDVGTLERSFGLPVLGAVSALRPAPERAAELRQIYLVAVAAILLVCVAGALVVAGDAGSRLLHAFRA